MISRIDSLCLLYNQWEEKTIFKYMYIFLTWDATYQIWPRNFIKNISKKWHQTGGDRNMVTQGELKFCESKYTIQFFINSTFLMVTSYFI